MSSESAHCVEQQCLSLFFERTSPSKMVCASTSVADGLLRGSENVACNAKCECCRCGCAPALAVSGWDTSLRGLA